MAKTKNHMNQIGVVIEVFKNIICLGYKRMLEGISFATSLVAQTVKNFPAMRET